MGGTRALSLLKQSDDGSKGISLQEDEIKQGAPAVKGDQGGDQKLASDHQPQQLAFVRKCFTNNYCFTK